MTKTMCEWWFPFTHMFIHLDGLRIQNHCPNADCGDGQQRVNICRSPSV